jgi:hypothetical protein
MQNYISGTEPYRILLKTAYIYIYNVKKNEAQEIKMENFFFKYRYVRKW